MRFSLPVLVVVIASILTFTPLDTRADSALQVTPYPVVAGEPALVQYDPAGRGLDGVAPVYLHYGFNGWSINEPDRLMNWNTADGVWETTIDVPAGVQRLDVVFNDGVDVWDNNEQADWHMIVLAGDARVWKLDGQLDDDARLVAERDGWALFAGLRADTLYVAALGATDNNDHFILIADTPGPLGTAPWGKDGLAAEWSALLGNEVDNGWTGWDSADGIASASGTWLEGTIDLAELFGTVPNQIRLAFAAYPTPDGSPLLPSTQVPASLDNDGNIDADEYVTVSLASIAIGCSAADLDNDCDEDADDWLELDACIDGPGIASCPIPDRDDDTDVDLHDVATFQREFGSNPATTAAVGDDLGVNATRFYADGVNLSELPPSMSLVDDPNVLGPAVPPPTVVPCFYQSGDEHIAMVHIDASTSLYGTGEICGSLRRNGHTTVVWSTDAYAYGPANPSLYQCHPWVLAVRDDGSAFGLLADTTYRCTIDLSNEIVFAAEGPPFPVYLFEGNTPQEVLVRLTDFIGRMPLPPLWSLGYQQSNYSYAPESYARWIADGFRNRDIPCDVIWIDIDHMDEYRIFTFDPTGYPDPLQFNNDMHADGFRTVWIIDPGVKVDPGYFVYDEGSTGDHWIRDAIGNWYTGEVWPGDCHFPDFTRPETRAWWAGLFPAFMAYGLDGVWNDMNEPGIFDGPNHSMPLDCQHQGGGGLPAGSHAQYHNVYGMLMSRASFEGVQAANPNKRPFVLSRSSFIGGHRYAAMWTGDNVATWQHLYYSTPMVLNIGLSGQPFAGPDLGGYAGDGTGDLFARWMGVGVFMPFCRAHSDGQGQEKEPWSFDAHVEAVCKTAIERRYRLLPYLYTVMQEASETGLPLARPVFFADPSDPTLRNENTAFLLGADVLVIPNVWEDWWNEPSPAVPAGIWRTISLVGEDSGASVEHPDLRVRGGAIVPLGPVMEYTGEAPLDPLTLIVSLDADGYAEGWLYEDDGDGYEHLAGDYRLARYTASESNDVVTIEVTEVHGARPTPTRQVEIEIVTDTDVITVTTVDSDSGVIASVPLN